MAEDFDKNIIDPSEKNNEGIENDKDIFNSFKNNLQYLAKDIYEQSQDIYHNALQSLEKWLFSKEKKVKEDTINELSQLRSSVEKVKGLDVVGGVDVPVPHTDDFERSTTAQKGIEKSYKNVVNMIAAASHDKNPIAAVLGRWMQKILNTES